MPLQQFSDSELHAKAVQLGVITEGEELPREQRSRVAAALLEERRAAKAPAQLLSLSGPGRSPYAAPRSPWTASRSRGS